jgi:hypothetical protein
MAEMIVIVAGRELEQSVVPRDVVVRIADEDIGVLRCSAWSR